MLDGVVLTEPTLVAKSNIILDVKPWADDTDMAEMERCVRSIEMDGLLWGACECPTSLHYSYMGLVLAKQT